MPTRPHGPAPAVPFLVVASNGQGGLRDALFSGKFSFKADSLPAEQAREKPARVLVVNLGTGQGSGQGGRWSVREREAGFRACLCVSARRQDSLSGRPEKGHEQGYEQGL